MRVRKQRVGLGLGLIVLVTLGGGSAWDLTQCWPMTVGMANQLNLNWISLLLALVHGSTWLSVTLLVLGGLALAGTLVWLGDQLSEPRPRLHR